MIAELFVRLTAHKFEPFLPSLLTNVAHWSSLWSRPWGAARNTPGTRRIQSLRMGWSLYGPSTP